MVSAGGLNLAEARWVKSLEFDHEQIMDLWRFAVTSYLWKANRDGLLRKSSLPEEFNDLILKQVQRDWNIHITRRMSRMHFLRYAGRYIRRLPISQKRILQVTEQEVVYQSKDTRTKALLETRCPPTEFVALLSQHVLDRYQHFMRYLGLLAPRTKPMTSAALFLLLGQTKRSRPQRLSWRNALRRYFQVDPLINSHGQSMHWVRRLKPVAS
ncbi:MAG: transposase [Acidobacteriaceae bacterium]